MDSITFTFTVASDLDAVLTVGYDAAKALGLEQTDDPTLAKVHDISVVLAADGPGSTYAFQLTIVDRCATPALTAPATTPYTYYVRRPAAVEIGLPAFTFPEPLCVITQADQTDY